MTDPAVEPGGLRNTSRGTAVALWILGVLFALFLGILAARRPLTNFFYGLAVSQENPSAAVRYITLSMLLAPSDLRMDVLYRRYQFLEQSGDFEGSERDLETMIRRDPGWGGGTPCHARGIFYMSRQRWDDAIADFQASMPYAAKASGFIDYHIGKCYLSKGDPKMARQHFEKAQASPDPVWSKQARLAILKLE